MARRNDANRIPVGRDGTYHYAATTLSVSWPGTEHGKQIARWPHRAAEAGATWDEHRRKVERHYALVARAGHSVSQTPGVVSGLEVFLRDKRIRTPSAQDLLDVNHERAGRVANCGGPPALHR